MVQSGKLPQAPLTCLAHMYQSLQPGPLSGGSHPSRVQVGKFTLLSRLISTPPTHCCPWPCCARQREEPFHSREGSCAPSGHTSASGAHVVLPCLGCQELRLGNHLETGLLWCYQDHSAALQQGRWLVPTEYQARLGELNLEPA